MPSEPSEADIQLGIAALVRVWNERAGLPAEFEATLAQTSFGRDITEAILRALAGAGRLLPSGGEATRWWGIQRTAHLVDSVGAGQGSYELAWIAARRRDGALMQRDVVDFPDGSQLVGPWVEADEDGTG